MDMDRYDLLPLRMWNNPDSTFVWRNQLSSGVPRLIFQLNVEFSDGSWQRISSAEADVRAAHVSQMAQNRSDALFVWGVDRSNPV
jgi:hypothetical protein